MSSHKTNFGTDHTMARYKEAFYKPLVADWNNFETWQETGEKTATQRANEMYKQLLEIYQKPEIDPAVEEELSAYVEKRRCEIKPSW